MLLKLLNTYKTLMEENNVPEASLDSEVSLDDIVSMDWGDWASFDYLDDYPGDLIISLRESGKDAAVLRELASIHFQYKGEVVRELYARFGKLDAAALHKVLKCLWDCSATYRGWGLKGDFFIKLGLLLYGVGDISAALLRNAGTLVDSINMSVAEEDGGSLCVLGLVEKYRDILSETDIRVLPFQKPSEVENFLKCLIDNNQLTQVCLQYSQLCGDRDMPICFFESPQNAADALEGISCIAGDDTWRYFAKYAGLNIDRHLEFIKNFKDASIDLDKIFRYEVFHCLICYMPDMVKDFEKIPKELMAVSDFLSMLIMERHTAALCTISSIIDPQISEGSAHFLNDTEYSKNLFDYDELSADDYAFIFQNGSWKGYKYTEGMISVMEFRELCKLTNSYAKLFSKLRSTKADAANYVNRLAEAAALSGIKDMEAIGVIGEYLENEDLLRWYEESGLAAMGIPMQLLMRAVLYGRQPFFPEITCRWDAEFLAEESSAILPGQTLSDARYNYVKYDFDANRLCRMFEVGTIKDGTKADRLAKLVLDGTVSRTVQALESIHSRTPRRLIEKAAKESLIGNYHAFKYGKGELSRELSMCIPARVRRAWETNISIVSDNGLVAAEYDDLSHIMCLGTSPVATSLNPKDGRYRGTLASMFNANKKVVEICRAGEVLKKYIITLTKYLPEGRVDKQDTLEFSRLEYDLAGECGLFLIPCEVNSDTSLGHREMEQCRQTLQKYITTRMAGLNGIELALDDPYYVMVPYTRAGRQFFYTNCQISADTEGGFMKYNIKHFMP